MTNETRELLERVGERFAFPEQALERLERRRDRKRRNQRITAGVVGIAIFVGAIWMITSGRPFDRTETPGGTGPTGSASPPTTPDPDPRPPLTTAPWFTSSATPEVDYVLDLDTGMRTPLPETIIRSLGESRPPSDGRYAASPDGSTLAYAAMAADGRYQIFVANRDGSGIRRVSSDPVGALSPAWSPDGTRIAYAGHTESGTRGLFVLGIASGKTTTVIEGTGPWTQPQFTPDGSSILYTGGTNYQPELRIVPIAGGESTLFIGVDRGLNDAGNGSISPDGSLVTYLGSGSPTGFGGHCGPCRLVANVDGTERRVVPGWMANPAGMWSPDGSRIVAMDGGEASHSYYIVVVDVATGQGTKVARGEEAIWLDNHSLLVEV